MSPAYLLCLILSMTSTTTSLLWRRYKNFGELLAPSNATFTTAVREECILHCEHAQSCVALTYVPGSTGDGPGECHLYEYHVTGATRGLNFQARAVYYSTLPPAPGRCPEGGDYFEVRTGLRVSCFMVIFDPKLTWNASRDFCRDKGGDLGMLTSLEENDAVTAEALKRDPLSGGGRVYMGLTDVVVEGQYRWLDGSEIAFQNFRTAGTDDAQDCAIIRVDTGEWADYDCSNSRPFLCEFRML